MIRHYLKIAVRNLLRFYVYSVINILGLSVGIAASLIILLYVSHEVSFDRFHPDAGRIFQVYCKINWGGKEIDAARVSSQFGPVIKQNNSHVINYVRIVHPGRKLVSLEGHRSFYENNFIFSDSSFFSVFSFPLLRGVRDALGKPNTVIISESAAKKYFGEDNPVGKIITYDHSLEFEVVGVAKDAPSNSTLTFDFVGSFPSLAKIPDQRGQYENNRVSLGNSTTYFLLDNKESATSTLSTVTELAASSADEKYKLKPLLDKHFDNADLDSPNYVYLFLLVAMLILGLALLNYVNLATARATLRAREVGIRKISGARRSSLATQFYFESALITLCSFLLAIAWLALFLPSFLSLLQLAISPSFILQPFYLSVISLLFIVCIFLSGSYPAIVLSGFSPTEVISGKLSGIGKGAWVRKGFTIFQFTSSAALIICSLVVNYQLGFLHSKKIGLNKDQLMVINLDPSMRQQYAALKNQLHREVGISNVGAASFSLFTGGTSALFIKTPRTKEDVFINVLNVDGAFIRTLEIEWVEKPDTLSQQNSILLNESALAELKLSKEDIHSEIELFGKKLILNGIVKDFNYESLRAKVNGLLISVVSDTSSVIAKHGGAIYLRLDPKVNLTEKVSKIEKIFKTFQPSNPFEYYFLDDAFDRLYKSEDRLANLFNSFTGISIFIGCLGLFGLISFTTQVKTKEIGIRKVMGASATSIVALLSKEFIGLLILSFMMAVPIAYWAMQNWLNGFSYKVEIPWWFALIAAVLLSTTALATITVQTIKAAMRNPVDSLRRE